MRGEFILLAFFVVCSALSWVTWSFASENPILPNNTFIELSMNDSDKSVCDGDAEFRVVQINPNSTKNGIVDFEITTSSTVIKLNDGVVGQGISKTLGKIDLAKPSDITYDIRCLDSSEQLFGENRTLSIKKEQTSSFFYDIKINENDYGLVTLDSYYFGSKTPTAKNSTFLIVTGADACNAYGAYRMVNVNFKENDEGIVVSEIDISSIFFGRTKIVEDNGLEKFDYLIVGDGKITQTIQTNVDRLPVEIKLDNDVRCIEENSDFTDEKFELTINHDGIGNLNLPPIRSQLN